MIGRVGAVVFLLTAPGQITSAYTQSEMSPLTTQYSREFISKAIKWDNSWIQYPAYRDRSAWNKIPEATKESLIHQGEQYLDFEWPHIKATDYLLFTRTGDRAKVDDLNRRRDGALNALMMAELTEGKGRFLDDLINGVFSTCQTTYWGSSAHFYLYGYEGGLDNPTTILPDIENPVIDIFGSNTAATLAWIYHFLHDEFDKISPVISQRIRYEINSKILQPYYQRDDFWWLFGRNGDGRVNNWNLWCNLNLLNVIMLMEDDPSRKLEAVYKNLSSVDVFINNYPPDGSCSEGPSYWGAAVGRLFTYLDLLHRMSDGRIDIFKNEKIRDMGRYIYRVYISNGTYYTNYADAPARISQGPERIFRIGQLIEDQVMQSFGVFLKSRSGVDRRGGASLEDLFRPVDWGTVKLAEPLIADYFFPDWDMALARDRQGTNHGFYFSAKGGNNAEQHNHNDVGSFMLYYNGQPVFLDVGVGNYTKETFGKGRYNIWTMQSNYHNLPVINGVGQKNGGNFKATDSKYTASSAKVSFSTDISKAYPTEAKVTSWIRSYTLERGKRFVINDHYRLTENKGGNTVNFMTNLLCSLHGPGVVKLEGKDFLLHMKYDAALLKATIEDFDITDSKLRAGVGEKVSRLVFELQGDQLDGNTEFEVVASK
ncbi:heparinase II/III family protein [Ravibacter arvi]|uniref:Heparinase II/III family protein n=2 Tax=Ravibacter arvi TaxID=2051041 RepID=A0ABP8M6E2_9BACT